MNQAWFITGTDTEIGKTWCTLAFIQYLKNKGLRVAGMKPIAAGCVDLRNSDAEQILALSDLEVPYDWVNPYAFAPPIAPHVAAEQVGQVIELEVILKPFAPGLLSVNKYSPLGITVTPDGTEIYYTLFTKPGNGVIMVTKVKLVTNKLLSPKIQQ